MLPIFFKHRDILPHVDHDGDVGDHVDDWFYFVVDWMEMFEPEISHFEYQKVWTGKLWTLVSCQRLHYYGPRPHSRQTLLRRLEREELPKKEAALLPEK